MGYVYFDRNCALQEGLLFVKPLEIDRTGASIFSTVKMLLRKRNSILWKFSFICDWWCNTYGQEIQKVYLWF